MGCGVVQSSTASGGAEAVRCGGVRCGGVKCGGVKCGGVNCGGVGSAVVRCGDWRCGPMAASPLPTCMQTKPPAVPTPALCATCIASSLAAPSPTVDGPIKRESLPLRASSVRHLGRWHPYPAPSPRTTNQWTPHPPIGLAMVAVCPEGGRTDVHAGGGGGRGGMGLDGTCLAILRVLARGRIGEGKPMGQGETCG